MQAGLETVVLAVPELARAFARRAEELARRAQRERGAFSIALPGGSVARAFLPVLAETAIDWGRVDLFFGDERAVPPDHPDSNYGLARRLLLDRIASGPGRVHRIRAEGGEPELAARAYEAELRRVLGDAAALDVALLGAGPDGHVCSLFEGHPLLRENARLVAEIPDSPKPPPLRITLTLTALRSARLLAVAAFGKEKAEAMRRALREPGCGLPVAIALRDARDALLLLDPAAALGLGSRG